MPELGPPPAAGLTPEKTEVLCRKATHIYLLLMVSAFPLFTGWDGYICLNEKKFAFFAVCTGLWALWTGSLTVLRAARGGRRPLSAADLLIPVCMAFCTLSALLSPEASFLSLDTGRCDGLLTYLLYGCILLGAARYGEAREVYLYVFGAAYAACCAAALLQLAGLDPLGLYPNGLRYSDPFVQETGRFLGTVGNIDLLSALNCLALPLLTAGAVLGRGRRRWALAVPLALGGACAALIGVASGLLALAVTACVFLPALSGDLCRRARPGDFARWRRARRGAALCAGLAAAAALCAVYFLPAPGALGELHSVLHGRISDSFGSGRVLIWKRVLGVIAAHPLLGIGPDCLEGALDMELTRYSPALGELLTATIDNAHNEYLQFLVSFGACAALPLAVWLARLCARAAKRRGTSHAAAALFPAAVCYLVQAFFNIGLCIVTPLFCIAAGLLAGETDRRPETMDLEASVRGKR